MGQHPYKIEKTPALVHLFAGTYTMPVRFGTGQLLEGKGKGIYHIVLDEDTGTMTVEDVAEGIANPSYLALSPDGMHLYAVNELKTYGGRSGGSVSAFQIDRGRLELQNVVPSGGEDPCYLTVDGGGKNLYAANFMSGSVAGYALLEDGRLGRMHSFFQHEGRGLRDDRQSGPHAHSVILTRDGRTALVPDLGLDRMVGYDVLPNGRLEADRGSDCELPPGAGPRYCTFSPDETFCYLINELDCTITVFDSREKKHLSPIQTISALLPDADPKDSICAHLAITPDGAFVYGSNRGHDTICGFRVEADGRLRFLGAWSCGGKTPRHFAIMPSGRHLLCANQDSDNIVCFAITDTGELKYRSQTAVPTPVCILPWVASSDL